MKKVNDCGEEREREREEYGKEGNKKKNPKIIKKKKHNIKRKKEKMARGGKNEQNESACPPLAGPPSFTSSWHPYAGLCCARESEGCPGSNHCSASRWRSSLPPWREGRSFRPSLLYSFLNYRFAFLGILTCKVAEGEVRIERREGFRANPYGEKGVTLELYL